LSYNNTCKNKWYKFFIFSFHLCFVFNPIRPTIYVGHDDEPLL
jgi:hypothetical protein